MNGMVWLWVISVVAPAWCMAAENAPLAAFPINETSLAQIQKQHPLATVEVADPVYKRRQRYQGFWLRDLLKDLSFAGHPESDVYVRFRCKDGYLPMMPLARALRGEGLLAVRDLGAQSGKDWEPVPDHAVPSTPAPSYLVWVAPPGGTEEYPWPYQIVAIELTSSADALGTAVTGKSKQPGYDLFVMHCLKCHAINGVGGTFGPELNYPCSVTQYWNPGFLSRFISNASSIRAGTKMPGFPSISGKDIQAIIEYLQYMGNHKKSGATCQIDH